MSSRRALLTFAIATLALACKIIPNNRSEFATIVHKRFDVQVAVRDQVAEVTVRPMFHNPNGFALEGTYFLALPADAQVQEFKLHVNGKEYAAELLNVEKAREQYKQFVQSQKSPALLELVGTQMLKANIGSIAANSDVDVTVKYTSLLKQENGLVEVDVPFTNQFGADYPVPLVTVGVTIEGKRAIKSVYSPTHAVDVIRRSDTSAKVSYEAKNYGPRKAFKLFYHVSDEDLGVTLLTFKQPGEDGFFALLASPKVKIDSDKVLSKDVVFVFDRSGSMSGQKMQQGRDALTYFIASLNDQDRFNIVDFSSDANFFEPEPVAATRENRSRANSYVEGLKAAGSTNISDALDAGMKMLAKSASPMKMVIFMTDGLPTVGEQRFDKILENVRAANPATNPARVFVFGVGSDVNTQFLDRLSEEHRGARDYVAQEEKIEAKVSGLIHKVANPVLGSLALDFGGVHVQDMYPKTLPDLFAGTQLVVFGRYRGTGPTKITLKGMAAGAERTFAYDVNLPESDTRHDTTPRLWASRKVAFLMDSIRLGGGAKQEVVDEILSLGKRYGIVTPYTAFLIHEDSAVGAKEDAREILGVVVERERLVPWPGVAHKRHGDEPKGGEHHAEPVRSRFGEPIDRAHVARDGLHFEERLVRGAIETAPRRGRDGARIGEQTADLKFDLFGRDEIVGVEILNELARRALDASVERRRLPKVFLSLKAQSRIAKPLDDARALIRRSIVDNDDFEAWPRLAENAVERFADEPFGVVAGDENRNERIGHERASLDAPPHRQPGCFALRPGFRARMTYSRTWRARTGETRHSSLKPAPVGALAASLVSVMAGARTKRPSAGRGPRPRRSRGR